MRYLKEFFRFLKHITLKNINLEIKKGEVLGIVGVNGAGKSTLLKIISGVLTPTSGRVNINGRINAILELGSSLKPEMTGRENIRLNLQINGIDRDKDTIIEEIIKFADIGEHIDQPVQSCSSAMKARLDFGIATLTDPDVLMVDEVLAVNNVLQGDNHGYDTPNKIDYYKNLAFSKAVKRMFNKINVKMDIKKKSIKLSLRNYQEVKILLIQKPTI